MGKRSSIKDEANDSYYFDDPEIEINPRIQPRKKFFSALIVLLGAALFLQTSFAANISLGGEQAIQFGQGILQTAACSGNTQLLVTPISTFTNSTGGGSYSFSSVKVSNIPDSCFGSDFIIKSYGNMSSTSLAIFNTSSTDAVVYNNAGNFVAGAGSTGLSVSSGSGEFTVSFASPVASSSEVFKVTIQSSLHANVSCALGGDCVINEVGPGGGRIFYVAAGGFACGQTMTATCKYLEVAPYGWNTGADPTRPWAQSTPVDYRSTNIPGAAEIIRGIGYGAKNTKAIVDQGNNNPATAAAPLAASYSVVVGGVLINDWFLPSQDELLALYNQRASVSVGITASVYWTSTTVTALNGRYVIMSDGTNAGQTKNNSYYVRPVRAF